MTLPRVDDSAIDVLQRQAQVQARHADLAFPGEEPEDSGPAEETAPERPRPRNKTAKARRPARSSVPSWDEIVFGSSSD